MIHYINDNLFNAPKDCLLVHACNAQGVWGSGIAKQFKEKFPLEFEMYAHYCSDNKIYLTQGTALIVNRVGCLITSKDYGNNVDPVITILMNTNHALKELISNTTMKIAMPKINSGLFKVPWENTEAILKSFNRDFYIYTGVK